MKRSTYLAGTIAVSALILTGCGSADTPSGGESKGRGATQSETPQEASIVGTWETGEIVNNEEQPFASFSADGNWVGSDGCNTVKGTYEIAADGKWTVTSGPQTLMACEGAPVPTWVATAVSAKIEGKSLEFTSSAGEVTTLVKVSADMRTPLAGFPLGRWGAPENDQPFLVFAEDSKVTGFDGCNQVRGEWTMGESRTLTLDIPASTRKACPGVDTWLAGATAGHLDDGSLVLQGGENVEIGRLPRGGLS